MYIYIYICIYTIHSQPSKFLMDAARLGRRASLCKGGHHSRVIAITPIIIIIVIILISSSSSSSSSSGSSGSSSGSSSSTAISMTTC